MSHTARERERKKRQAREQANSEKTELILKQHKKEEKEKKSLPLWMQIKNDITGGQWGQDNSNKDLWDSHWFVRNPENWEPKSHSYNKQKVELIKWVYCKYEVPKFLIDFIISKIRQDRNTFFMWFLSIANGFSFAKEAKDFFTKKEAHLFLTAPSNLSAEQAFWWAKCKANKVSDSTTRFVLSTFTGQSSLRRKIYWDLIPFIERFKSELDLNHFNEIMDFLRNQKHDYSLAGRTASSLIKLSNEWHYEQAKKDLLKYNLKWDGMNIEDYIYENEQSHKMWTIEQLLTDKQLYTEGRTMRHCVGSYAQRCAEGMSFIFSLRDDGAREATIEVNDRNVITQCRGKLNGRISGEARSVIRRWARENRFKIGIYAGI